MSNLWSGRFSKELDSAVNDFNSSLHFDRRMYAQDIAGSVAHAKMLAATGIIPAEDGEKIVQGLLDIKAGLEDGSITLDPSGEDIHMSIEALLTERIGEAGKRLHTARSRNDQVAVDLRMYLRDALHDIDGQLTGLIAQICKQARAHLETVMPGYTHLQRAQPTTYAHAVMAYAEMFLRDKSRLADCLRRMDVMPLGSGAMGGTTYPIDREMTASLLGFSAISRNSIDGVSDRDFVVEACAALSLIMMHLSRFSEEIILWCSSEFGFLELDDAYSTGSSIMPQKKNPDIAELVRGKTGRVYGSLMGILTVMKGLPQAYNKDMQEDKEGLFDALDTVAQCLHVFTPMLDTLTVSKQNMLRAAQKGFINATDCADFLTKKGVPFRDAYTASGKLVRYCISCGKTLDELSLDEFHAVHPGFDEGVYHAIDLLTCVAGRSVIGGPAPQTVAKHIAEVESLIGQD